MLHASTSNTKVVNLPRLVEPQKTLSFTIHTDNTKTRAPLESFIQQIFMRAYNAHIHTFYPALISITRADESFAAVAGFRSATKPLFAESYLDQPVESLLAKYGYVVERSAIVEMGNLAPANAGQARWLIAALTSFLYSAGFSWVIFTAVPALHNAFARMGIPLLTLAEADINCLDQKSKDEWGSYYKSRPMVYAANIHNSYNTLNQQISSNMPRLKALWLQAQMEGCTYSQSAFEESQVYSTASL